MESEFEFMKDVKVEAPKKTDIFFEGYFKGKPRPDHNSKEVKMLVVEKILDNIISWLDEDDERREDGADEDSIRDELMLVISYSKDGYEMAKNLDDDYSWSSDSNLVDILDSLSFYDARKKLVQKWIKDNDIKPFYLDGQEVTISSKHLPYKYRDKPFYKGIVIKVNFEEGTYLVKSSELGHVSEGLGTHGIILDWDKVEKI